MVFGDFTNLCEEGAYGTRSGDRWTRCGLIFMSGKRCRDRFSHCYFPGF